MALDHPGEPWYRPGKISILAALAVLAAFIAVQPDLEPSPLLGGSWAWEVAYCHGWPAGCACRVDTQIIVVDAVPPWASATTTTTSTTYHWRPTEFVIDGLAAFFLPFSTMFVVERWRRSGWQFTIRSLMVLVGVAAVAVFLGQHDPAILGTIHRDGSYLSVAISIPLAVAVGCAIFTLSWLVFVPFEVVWQAAHGRDPWA